MAHEFEDALWQFRSAVQRKRRLIKVVAGAIVLVLIANSTLFSVDADSEGVVLRFGRFTGDVVGPGLHAKWLWPIDAVRTVPVQKIQTLEFGYLTASAGRDTVYSPPTVGQDIIATMLTGDLNLAHIEWIVQYRVNDAYKYLFRIGGAGRAGDAVADLIQDASESIMRQLVGDVSVDEAITIGRDQIAADAKDKLQRLLDAFDCGVQVVTIRLQSAAPPEEVKDAFDAVNRAMQTKDRTINDAWGERNKLIPAARGQRDRSISEAEGYKERVVRTAKGEASAFLARLAAYETAPEVTRTRLYLEAMEELLAGVEHKIIVDESVRSLLPLLPLDVHGADDAKGGRP